MITCVIWTLSPSAGFLGFLLFSSYHFGETDLRDAEYELKTGGIVITVYGIGIIGCLITASLSETFGVLEFLSPVFSPKNHFIGVLIVNSVLIWVVLFLPVCLISTFLFLKSTSAIRVKIRLFIPCILLLILYPLPLFTAFSFYFGLWHSLHALSHIRKHLQCTTKQMVKEALPFSAISILGLLFFLTVFLVNDWSPILVAFVFISALTTPHAGVMRTMYDKVESVF
jgi:beta-carotene 15,15'-dioxygenase